MPRLTKIIVYPIKSFDGVEVDESGFTPAGGLRNDRRFALQKPDGKFVNGKAYAAMHRLRSTFDLAAETVTLSAADRPSATFALAAGNADLERWCGEYFGTPVRFIENRESGFPDDGDSPGATLISVPTLLETARWFPSLDVAEMRRRFRANLEVDAAADAYDPEEECPAFWEDRLFSSYASPDTREVVPFRIGDVVLAGVNPCARCVVPTRDSQTGEVFRGFAQTFAERRRNTLPRWAAREPFDHYYRLSVNTRLGFSETEKTIRLGDRVDLV
ncbi:MAG: MOSC N-terminal beta barrel domain-containing protein [Planctomycetia bacterium]|nr:MOSC N-terminal beta barrel domain-containing protein [Planctomycetia bacterium]